MNKNKNHINCIISACLVGVPCRWNAKHKFSKLALIEFQKGNAILVCPELMSGMKIPRAACEISNGDGLDVLNNKAKVIDKKGDDYTNDFIAGSQKTINEIVKKNKIKKAILKSGSPSCGVKTIYSGKFNGKKIKGSGVFTALLKKNGIKNIIEI
jgi:uncharacterized protein YbbK (DUF523 family)